jgi:hypothetical protein
VLLLAVLSGGCGVAIATSSTFGAVFNGVLAIGVGSGATYDEGTPPLNPERRIVERDCTMPIEDYSANLRCR